MTDAGTIPSERDISAIAAGDWPVRELVGHVTGRREARFQVVFRQSVLDQIHLHGQSTTEVEVCGVLVGNGYRDARGPYLLIEHCIRGTAAASRSTNVTFTADTWQHIQATMDREHAKAKIVGWYHTHPGFGIFLSDMDVFICENFFNLPWQVAFVYDPISGEEGDFLWRAGRPERDPVLIEHDVTPASASIALISKQDAMAAPSIADDRLVELQRRVRQLERRQRVMLLAIAFLVAFATFWLMQNAPTPPAVKGNGSQPTTMPRAGLGQKR
ncbi:MAG TPA: Mov34/MPN/PAD-1 family protein [Tepidisphaeraceae bacterium]|nr:Mov34/MPN/PAD-1 family protein [Tepidisphaeraceae bacterium]